MGPGPGQARQVQPLLRAEVLVDERLGYPRPPRDRRHRRVRIATPAELGHRGVKDLLLTVGPRHPLGTHATGFCHTHSLPPELAGPPDSCPASSARSAAHRLFLAHDLTLR